MGRFGTVLTAMVTPFDDDMRLDLGATADLARWLVEQGNDGLVLAGTTGENPTLSDEEKVQVWQAVRDAVDVPLIAGTGFNDTSHTISVSRQAADCGMDGQLVVCPYYNRPSQAGIEAHVRAVAEATDLPIIVYDIPARTGRKVETETLLRLAREVPTMVGLKDAAADPAETARVIAAAPEGFEVYSGDDKLTLALLALGAVGTIGVATHWTARQHVEMLKRFATGDVEGARSINAGMIESFRFEGTELAPNPVPTKAMLRELGMPVGSARLPMGPEPEWLAEQARGIARRLGLLD